MLGLTVTALQHFTLDTYGHEAWRHAVKAVLGDFQKFEALLVYDDDVVFALIKELAESNNRIRKDLEENIGNYLVSSKNMKSLRRLLRFGGATFEDFVMSLNDLNERVDLALSELNLPTVQSRQQDDGSYLLRVEDQWSGFENVIVGILRALQMIMGSWFWWMSSDTPKVAMRSKLKLSSAILQKEPSLSS